MFGVATVAFVIGAILPWIEAPTLLGTIGATGLDRGDGPYVILTGLVTGTTAVRLVSGRQPGAWERWIDAAVITVFLGLVWNAARTDLPAARTAIPTARIGSGLWLIGVGTVALWAATWRTPLRPGQVNRIRGLGHKARAASSTGLVGKDLIVAVGADVRARPGGQTPTTQLAGGTRVRVSKHRDQWVLVHVIGGPRSITGWVQVDELTDQDS